MRHESTSKPHPSSTKLTARAIDRMRLPPGFKGRQFDYKDTQCQGLYLRVYDTGAKRYLVRYRLNGHRRLLVLGSTDDLGLQAARAAAAEVVALARKGTDPKAAKGKEEKQVRRDGLTFRDFALSRYLEGYAKAQNRDWRRKERHLEAFILPTFGDMALDEITYDDVLDWLAEQRKRAPVGADRVAATLSKIFTLALQQGKIRHHPAYRLPKMKRPERERVLTNAEIVRLWNEATTGKTIHIATGLALRLTLLTGQRASEIAHLPRQGELDLPGKLWSLPATRAKNNRTHVLPLSDLAVETIKAAMEVSSHPDYVFSAYPGKCLNATSLTHAMHRLFGHGENAPTTHDLRRTFATRISMLQVEPEVRERLLTHTLDRLIRTYDKWSYLPQMREAVDLWATYLTEIVTAAGSEFSEADD